MTLRSFSTKNLRWIRNIAVAAEMIVVLILWTFIPAVIENNSIVHVGNGKYGLKAGFLLLALLPLLGLLTRGGSNWDDVDIHTDDAAEKARIEDARKSETLKCQILLSVFCFFAACFGVIAAINMG